MIHIPQRDGSLLSDVKKIHSGALMRKSLNHRGPDSRPSTGDDHGSVF